MVTISHFTHSPLQNGAAPKQESRMGLIGTAMNCVSGSKVPTSGAEIRYSSAGESKGLLLTCILDLADDANTSLIGKVIILYTGFNRVDGRALACFLAAMKGYAYCVHLLLILSPVVTCMFSFL